jgi:phage/conjugal plasmid C-4 type zinc finger TraR family protein
MAEAAYSLESEHKPQDSGGARTRHRAPPSFTAVALSSGCDHQWMETDMATGWAGDGAVQEQIDATVEDAIKRARSRLGRGPSLAACEECDTPIPQARRAAVPGVRLCVECQQAQDDARNGVSGYNRRGSKDSQLR